MYELLKGNQDFRTLKRPGNIEYHCIFDTIRKTGGHRFLHGVAIEEFAGRLAACFAFNEGEENSVTERLYVCWSDDGGRSWSEPEDIAPPAEYASSHSVFLPQEDALWCFGPRFGGLGERPVTKRGYWHIHFLGLQTQAWKYSGGRWTQMGIVADGFWPLGAPVRLDDGNWMMPGCDQTWLGAIALSRGDDLLHWDIIRPDTDGHVFTEAAAWASGDNVLMVMRNQHTMTDGKYYAAVARSTDRGKTFSPCELSNLPMCTTKPFCGRLDDGRPFMVFNESIDGMPEDRSRLLLGVGEKSEMSISRLYLVDEGNVTSGGRRLMLSYPYARQIGKRLYIAYSGESTPGRGGNLNDAMLAVIDMKELD